MKIVSWNVNGIESRRKSLIKLLNNSKPDIFCAQEVKTMFSLILLAMRRIGTLQRDRVMLEH